MQFSIVYLLAAFAVVNVKCDVRDADRILAKIDFEAVRSSGRLFQNMFNCFIDGIKCTADARDLKEFFPEMLETCCKECSENLLRETKKMGDFLFEQKRDYGIRLLDKYDPNREHRNRCDAALKAKGIDLTRF